MRWEIKFSVAFWIELSLVCDFFAFLIHIHYRRVENFGDFWSPYSLMLISCCWIWKKVDEKKWVCWTGECLMSRGFFFLFCLIFICRALAIASIVKFFHQIYENFHFDCRIILDILKDMKILEIEASVSFTNSIGFLWLHLASSLEINFPKNSSCFINFWSIVLIGHNHFFSLTLPTSQYELLNVF